MKQNLFYIFLFFIVFQSQAQLRLLPLTHAPSVHSPRAVSSARVQASPLELPFFDDFSTYFGAPDTNKWINRGAVVGNTFAIRPPSKGTVILDGLRENGVPYDPTVSPSITQTATDTLTSRPINLSGRNPSSNVLMSFWYANQSYGENPDPTDSLVLEFKDRNSTWRKAWSKTGDFTQRTSPFEQVVLSIDRLELLHGSFQFRFVAFGRPSGLYDVWNLDYFLIIQNPSFDIRSLRDLAVTTQPKSLLKRYSSMPLDQFVANPAAELADGDSTGVFNQENVQTGAFLQVSYGYQIRNAQTNQTIYQYTSPSDITLRSRRDTVVGVPIPDNLSVGGSRPLQLQSQFNIVRLPSVPEINLNLNDTIGRTTVLDNYYAYDDGTAEYGISGVGRQGQAVVRFILNKPDTLTAVNILFTRVTNRDLRGQTFVLTIRKRLDNSAQSVLYENSYSIRYRDTLNAFVTYPLVNSSNRNLAQPIAVSDTIYVGWRQVTEDPLAVGYDLNTESRNQQFYDISARGQWQYAFNAPGLVPGSIMIRPVFGQGLVTGIEPPITGPSVSMPEFQVFPNPTDGRLTWNLSGVRGIQVYNVLGQLVKAVRWETNDTKEWSLADLPNGVYMLTFRVNQRTTLRKIVIAK